VIRNEHWNNASATAGNARRPSTPRIPANAWVKNWQRAQEATSSAASYSKPPTPLSALRRVGATDSVPRGPATRVGAGSSVERLRRRDRGDAVLGVVVVAGLLAVLAWAATGIDAFALIAVVFAAGAASFAIAATAYLRPSNDAGSATPHEQWPMHEALRDSCPARAPHRRANREPSRTNGFAARYWTPG